MQPYDRPLEIARRRGRQSFPDYLPSDYRRRKAITATSNTDDSSTRFAGNSAVSQASSPVASGSGSGQPSSPASTGSDNLDIAEKVLLRLLGGEGVSWLDQRHMIEECDSCKRYFLSNYLRAHILECAKDDFAPMDEVVDDDYYIRFRSESVEV